MQQLMTGGRFKPQFGRKFGITVTTPRLPSRAEIPQVSS